MSGVCHSSMLDLLGKRGVIEIAVLPVQAQGDSKGTPLKNVVDVTMEVSAGTPGYAAVVRDELAALIIGKTYLDVSNQDHPS